MAVFNVGSGVRGKKKKKAVVTEQYPEPIGPVQKKEEERKPLPPSPPGTIVRDAETGIVKGFINSTGDFVKGRKEDAAVVLAKQQEKLAPMPGEVTTEQFAQAQSEQQQLQQQASTIGQLQPSAFAPVQQAPIDWAQAGTAGVAGVIPSVITGAGAGAAVGLAGAGVGVVPGAIIGAGAGLIAGIWRGTASNIKSQQRGEIGASQDVLTQARTNMRQLAMLASQDPANAAEYIQAYNAQLSLVHQAHRKIKAETDGNLNKFMEDGTDILSDFELFLGPNGTADIYGNKLRVALTSGVPIPLTEADLPE